MPTTPERATTPSITTEIFIPESDSSAFEHERCYNEAVLLRREQTLREQLALANASSAYWRQKYIDSKPTIAKHTEYSNQLHTQQRRRYRWNPDKNFKVD